MSASTTGNGRVRRADLSSGIITTLAGPPERTLAGEYVPVLPITIEQPKRIALDDKGTLFIADNTGHRILKLLLER